MDTEELAGTVARIQVGGALPGLGSTLRGPDAASGALPPLTALPPLEPADAAALEFQVHEVLGEGGMGVVELASQRALGREVALKRVRPDRESARAAAGLVAEARITGQLEHPNVVPVHALGRDGGGLPVLVMKRLTGALWRDLLRDPAHPGFPEDAARERLEFHLGVLCQVANALEFAHAHGIVHRDVKPENVMVGAHGEIYLLDWGIALQTRPAPAIERTVVGTLGYIAPEMLGGTGPFIGPRTDVFLLGATLHEVLTGRRLHAGATPMALVHAILSGPPAEFAPDVPEELAALCRAATARDPLARPASALAFRRAVQSYLSHRASIALADAAERAFGALAAAHADLAGESGTGSEGESARERRRALETRIEEHWGACRFGFRQALDSWPDNERARSGLGKACALMIEHALARREPAAAARLVTLLPAPRPDLEARVSALAALMTAEQAELGSLRHDARDRSLAAGARARAIAAGVSAVCFTAIMLVIDRTAPPEGPSHATLAALAGGVASAYAVLALAGRRTVTSTAVGRQTLALLVSVATLFAGIHLACMALDASVAVGLCADLVSACAAIFGFGLAVDRRMLFITLPLLAAATLIAIFPLAALWLFSGAIILNHLLAASLYLYVTRTAARS